MKRVWLLRHAKSSWDDELLGDHERPLAPRGRKAAARIARWAAANGLRPDLVLCSTAVRARATLEIVLPELGDPDVEIEPGLYHAWDDALIARLQALPDGVRAVLLVGHNPGLHDLACTLAPPGPEAFPTGALAEIHLDADEWTAARGGCGELRQFVTPRALS